MPASKVKGISKVFTGTLGAAVSIKDILRWMLSAARGFWYAVAPFVLAPLIFVVTWYVVFSGQKILVTNESSLDLKGVTLQRYSLEGDRSVVWVEDLGRGESEWRYTLPGEHGVLLRYERDGKEIRYECENGSHGPAILVEFHIEPDGTIWCEDFRLF